MRRAYAECAERLRDPKLSDVVSHGLTVLYGPPIERPDLMILSFQGGGENPLVQTGWPERLYYLDDPFRFGRALRGLCADVGLEEILEHRTMALPTVFPQAPSSAAAKWMQRTGPRADWREFSRDWVEQIVRAAAPAAILVFGEKAGRVMEVSWQGCERNHRQNHLTYAEGRLLGCPAVFSHHLSQGYVKSEVVKALSRIAELIRARHAA